MNRKIAIVVSLLLIMIIVISYIILNRPVSSAVIYVNPQTVEGAVGQSFMANISISNVADLYGWRLKLRWNETVLDVISATEGAFLKSKGNTFFYQANTTEGHLVLDCTLLGNVSGVSGDGTLVAIQFHVKGSGSCDLDIYDTMLINSAEESIIHTVVKGIFHSTS